MKRKIFTTATLGLFLIATVAHGQVLETENFDGLEIGIINENIEGMEQGQGGYQVYAPTHGGITNSGPENFQIIEREGANKMLMIEGCDWGSEMGGEPRRINKLELKNNWPTRTPGNNILKLTYEFFTGGASEGHHNLCVGVVTYNIDLSFTTIRVVEIEFDNQSKAVWGVTWFKQNGSLGNYSVPFATEGACILPENTWVTMDMYWDSQTGEVRWESDYFSASAQSLITEEQLDDYGLIGMISVDSAPKNGAAEVYHFDNWTISAIEEIGIDETAPKYTDRKNLAFHVANNALEIDRTVTVKAINIYGMDGRLLINRTNPGNTIDLSGINQGIYILNVETDRGNYKEKFIK